MSILRPARRRENRPLPPRPPHLVRSPLRLLALLMTGLRYLHSSHPHGRSRQTRRREVHGLRCLVLAGIVQIYLLPASSASLVGIVREVDRLRCLGRSRMELRFVNVSLAGAASDFWTSENTGNEWTPGGWTPTERIGRYDAWPLPAEVTDAASATVTIGRGRWALPVRVTISAQVFSRPTVSLDPACFSTALRIATK